MRSATTLQGCPLDVLEYTMIDNAFMLCGRGVHPSSASMVGHHTDPKCQGVMMAEDEVPVATKEWRNKYQYHMTLSMGLCLSEKAEWHCSRSRW